MRVIVIGLGSMGKRRIRIIKNYIPILKFTVLMQEKTANWKQKNSLILRVTADSLT